MKPEAASFIGQKGKLLKDDGSHIQEHSFGMVEECYSVVKRMKW